jgi:hypothetical protein
MAQAWRHAMPRQACALCARLSSRSLAARCCTCMQALPAVGGTAAAPVATGAPPTQRGLGVAEQAVDNRAEGRAEGLGGAGAAAVTVAVVVVLLLVGVAGTLALRRRWQDREADALWPESGKDLDRRSVGTVSHKSLGSILRLPWRPPGIRVPRAQPTPPSLTPRSSLVRQCNFGCVSMQWPNPLTARSCHADANSKCVKPDRACRAERVPEPVLQSGTRHRRSNSRQPRGRRGGVRKPCRARGGFAGASRRAAVGSPWRARVPRLDSACSHQVGGHTHASSVAAGRTAGRRPLSGRCGSVGSGRGASRGSRDSGGRCTLGRCGRACCNSRAVCGAGALARRRRVAPERKLPAGGARQWRGGAAAFPP